MLPPGRVLDHLQTTQSLSLAPFTTLVLDEAGERGHVCNAVFVMLSIPFTTLVLDEAGESGHVCNAVFVMLSIPFTTLALDEAGERERHNS